MPIYEYTCVDCETHFEKLVRSISQVVDVRCPECGGTHVKKGWSLFGMGQAAGGDGAIASAASNCAPTGT